MLRKGADEQTSNGLILKPVQARCMFLFFGACLRDALRSYGIQFSEVPNGLGALSKVPALGWLQIITLAGITEVQIYKDPVKGEPGNYGAGFLGVKSIGLTSNGFTDPEYRKMKLNAELANGRLAMMAIIGMFFQD
eukprot:731255-Pyramimonas_sp.AAC.1